MPAKNDESTMWVSDNIGI